MAAHQFQHRKRCLDYLTAARPGIGNRDRIPRLGGGSLNSPGENREHWLDDLSLGLGAWAWGDRLVWQYGRDYGEPEIRQAFEASIARGIVLIDTAEVYGSGRSERYVGQFARERGADVLVATKFFPWPWRLGPGAVPTALRNSLARLEIPRVDLYQIHGPSPLVSVELLAKGLVECVQSGLARSVGVSNFHEGQMLRAYTTLARNGIPLASNQVHFSLLNRDVEKNGLLARCRELGVKLIAYSPLEMGLLTGKYGPDHVPAGSRALRYPALLRRIHPLLRRMTEIGQDHGGKANAQVALNWAIRKGALAIPGAKNGEQAEENAGALGWSLSDAEVADLDAISDRVA